MEGPAVGSLRRERAVCDGVDQGAIGALDPARPKPEIRHRNNPARPRGQEVIPTLTIEKAAPGECRATVNNGRSEQADFHIWVEHVSIGTTPTQNMRHDPETLANCLSSCTGSFEAELRQATLSRNRYCL